MQNFQNLRLLENTLNKAALKKYLEFEEQHNSRLKCIKRLRIFLKLKVGNSVKLRIDGRVINDYRNIVETRMSELLKRVVVVFDEEADVKYLDQLEFESLDESSSSVQRDNETNINLHDCKSRDESLDQVEKENTENEHTTLVADATDHSLDVKNRKHTSNESQSIYEWHNNGDRTDAFELVCNKIPRSIKILIEFDNSKDLVRLSDSLQKIIQADTITRTNAIIGFWKYLRTNKLIGKDGYILRDDKIKEVFANDVHIDEIVAELNKHFLPLEILAFRIPVTDYERIFDVKVERDDLTDFPVLYKNKNINMLEKKILSVLEGIERSKDRLDVLKRFADDPEIFMRRHIAVESKDLDFIGISDKGIFADPKILESIYEIVKKQ